MLIVTGSDVSEPPPASVAVTPVPSNQTAVTPVKFVPVKVADTTVPCAPEGGVIDVIPGTLGFTVKPSKGADEFDGPVTVTERAPTLAPGATVTVTGRAVGVPTPCIMAVTPLPLNVTPVAPFRLFPEMVAENEVPYDSVEIQIAQP